MIQIDALSAFNDNYIWLLQDATSRRCAVVDPGDAKPVEAWLAAHPDWRLSDILVTHHHHDHVGGVAALKELTGARVLGPANEKIPARDLALEDGERVEVLGLVFEIFHVPGHTLGHIAYYHPAETPLLFCGDTLFAAGCGRLFEGTPAQMHHSLARLAALPANTRVYCTHEYTLSNLRFALAVEPDNAALRNASRKRPGCANGTASPCRRKSRWNCRPIHFFAFRKNLLRKSRPAERPAKPHPGGGFRRPEGLEGPVLKVGEILTTLEVISRIG